MPPLWGCCGRHRPRWRAAVGVVAGRSRSSVTELVRGPPRSSSNVGPGPVRRRAGRPAALGSAPMSSASAMRGRHQLLAAGCRTGEPVHLLVERPGHPRGLLGEHGEPLGQAEVVQHVADALLAQVSHQLVLEVAVADLEAPPRQLVRRRRRHTRRGAGRGRRSGASGASHMPSTRGLSAASAAASRWRRMLVAPCMSTRWMPWSARPIPARSATTRTAATSLAPSSRTHTRHPAGTETVMAPICQSPRAGTGAVGAYRSQASPSWSRSWYQSYSGSVPLR